MPAIALFIKELLAEDKYDGTFTSKIDERISVLNAAQLQGLYNHLVTTATSSKTALWRTANQEIVDRIRDTLESRVKQVAAEQKIIEEFRLQQKQKKIAKIEVEREKQRVKEMIYQKAHAQAEREIRDLEMVREAKEKLEIMQRVFKAEEKRNKHLAGTCAFFLFGIAAVVVGVYFLANSNLIFMGAGIVFVLIVCIGSTRYALNLTKIKPAQVLPEDLEAQIVKREDELQEQAYLVLREKEKKFEEQEKRDKLERKRRKQQRREQQQYEIELMEQQRTERIRMAREVVERQQLQRQGSLTADDLSITSLKSGESSLENHAADSVQNYSAVSGWRSRTSSVDSDSVDDNDAPADTVTTDLDHNNFLEPSANNLSMVDIESTHDAAAAENAKTADPSPAASAEAS